MFDGLSEQLGGIFDGLRKRGALTEAQVAQAMEEVRLALLDADVAVAVAKEFVAAVGERAVGTEVLASVTPGQMVVKIVHDRLVETLGTDEGGVNLAGAPPVAVLMVGLQGSGKTTTTAKLASRIVKRQAKKVLMASLDVYRPAAQQQLARLGERAEIPVLQPVLGERPLAIARRAMDGARKGGLDVVILDTAGRLHVDADMMAEAAEIARATEPIETLLVADAMTGQDAVNVAGVFHDKVGITGIVLTRVDGDARGGAALSMKAVTGCPVKLMGTGEKLDALEAFQPERVAGSILGMGDVVGLVEKASEAVDKADAEKLAAKMVKGRFTLEDMAGQFKRIKKMGDIQGLIGMLPGAAKIKGQLAGIDERMIARQEAVILSMTPAERTNPKVLNGSRRRRIAAGSGTSVQDVNRLLKQFKQMSTMMKKAGKRGGKGMLPPMPPGMMPPMG